jgi:hypothetical protein
MLGFNQGVLLSQPPNSNPYQPNSKQCGNITCLKGLSHEIDFKNFDKNLQNLA